MQDTVMTFIPLVFKRPMYNMPIEYFFKDIQGTNAVVTSGEGAGWESGIKGRLAFHRLPICCLNALQCTFINI